MTALPYSTNLIAAAAIILTIVAVIVLISGRSRAETYEQRPSVLTQAEQRFFKVLQRAAGDHVYIMAKVRLADLVKVSGSRSKKAFWKAFRPIAAKHIDFVLIDRETFKTLCLIELDDRSHEDPQRQKSDRFKDQTAATVGFPLVRVRVQRRYDVEEVRELLEKYTP